MKQAFMTLVLAGLVAGLVAAPGASGADAGIYTFWACRTPDGASAPTDGFRHSDAVGTTQEADNACANGGTMHLSVANPQSGWYAVSEGWFFNPPASLGIAGMTVRRSVTGMDGDSTMFYATGETTDVCDSGHPCSGASDYEWTRPVHQVSFTVGCRQTSGCHASTGANEATADVSRVAVKLLDDQLPTFASTPAGDLLAATVRGTASLAFTTQDAGGGVYQSALLIDGTEQPRQVIDDNNGKCQPPFVHSVPCRATVEGHISFDTSTLADGPHTVGVVVYDATGSNNVSYGPVTVNVDNVPDPAGPDPGSESVGGSGGRGEDSARLLGIGRFTRHLVRQFSARPTVVRGRLVDRSGAPIKDATISVLSRTKGSNDQLLGTAHTRADGTFRFVVAKGPSRSLTFRYAPDNSTNAELRFRLVVPAPLKLVASRAHLTNGKKLLLTAYLSGVHISARSAGVAFQVLIGHQRRTFATRPINAQGIARIGHRFKVTYQRLTYRFRAVIVGRKGKGFPFANATSQPVAIQVN